MIGKWRAVDVTDDTTEEGMRRALDEGPYGRCVFHCDNNVCDQQTTAIQFENGVTAAFQMSAFSDHMHRRIKIMCEHGSIRGDDAENHLTITRFGSFADVPTPPEEIALHPYRGRHGGGDIGLVDAFVQALAKKTSQRSRVAGTPNGEIPSGDSEISRSIESHLIANAAEESRLTGETVYMNSYKDEIRTHR